MANDLDLDNDTPVVVAPPIPEEPVVTAGEEYVRLAVRAPWGVSNFQAHSENPDFPSVLITSDGTRVLAAQADEIIASAASVGVTVASLEG